MFVHSNFTSDNKARLFDIKQFLNINKSIKTNDQALPGLQQSRVSSFVCFLHGLGISFWQRLITYDHSSTDMELKQNSDQNLYMLYLPITKWKFGKNFKSFCLLWFGNLCLWITYKKKLLFWYVLLKNTYTSYNERKSENPIFLCNSFSNASEASKEVANSVTKFVRISPLLDI